MIGLPSLAAMDRQVAARIFLCTRPTDMRRGFDTLAAMVHDFLGHDPLSGDLFLFVSRGRDRLKVLYWDQDGYALWYKRLEEGTFRLPAGAAAGSSASGGGCGAGVELKASELAMLLAGIDLRRLPRSRRFSRPAPAQPHASA